MLSCSRIMQEQGYCNACILRLCRGGTGILKIGKTLGGTGTVRRVLMEQSRPFDIDAAEAAFASQRNGDGRR